MKIICTTSNNYLHLIPVFCYLFNKYWSDEQQVTVLGYDAPAYMPVNFYFRSMGKQGDVSEWSTDLRKYFQSIKDEYICWLMEDCFLRREVVDRWAEIDQVLCDTKIGRFDLTNDIQKRHHYVKGHTVYASPYTNYRLSTQPSVWNKKFLLQYLTPGLSPWIFEKQDAVHDGWHVVGFTLPPVKCNEGVRKDDPHKLDLNGFDDEDVNKINSLL